MIQNKLNKLITTGAISTEAVVFDMDQDLDPT